MTQYFKTISVICTEESGKVIMLKIQNRNPMNFPVISKLSAQAFKCWCFTLYTLHFQTTVHSIMRNKLNECLARFTLEHSSSSVLRQIQTYIILTGSETDRQAGRQPARQIEGTENYSLTAVLNVYET